MPYAQATVTLSSTPLSTISPNLVCHTAPFPSHFLHALVGPQTNHYLSLAFLFMVLGPLYDRPKLEPMNA
jgi:hypothetical protein